MKGLIFKRYLSINFSILLKHAFKGNIIEIDNKEIK